MSGPRRLDPHDFAPADLFDHLIPPEEPTMSDTTTPAPVPNTMTILELTGEILEELRRDFTHDAYLHTYRIGLEVDPDGTQHFKVKANESQWTPPLEGGSARVERLYDV